MSKLNKNCIVFFDFDNTIALYDVFDDIILRFARDNSWMEFEEKWKRRQIGSRECLQGQLNCIQLDKRALDEYLTGVRLDPYFKKLIRLLNGKGVETIILSDNFDYILKRLLKQNGIHRIKVYANNMEFNNGRPRLYFPFQANHCKACAHCKTKNLLANVRKNPIIIYIGDGRSDICPAHCADIVFAKDSLSEYYRANRLKYLPFSGLREVYTYLKKYSF